MIAAIVIAIVIACFVGLSLAAQLNASPSIASESNDYGEKHRTS